MINILKEETENRLYELSQLELGSEEYKTAVESVTKLVNTANDIRKTEADAAEKQKNAKSEKIKDAVKIGLELTGIVLPVAVTIWGTKVSLQFEETGTVTTIMGRGFINKLLPKK